MDVIPGFEVANPTEPMKTLLWRVLRCLSTYTGKVQRVAEKG